MENSEERFFTVGEIANKVGVTIRTLQYYDRTGLLKSTFSEGGRRMYTRNDILKLQQIVFLKSFGFSLEEIKDKILKSTSPADLGELFTHQREILLEQINYLNEIVNLLDTVITDTQSGEQISVDKLMTIMELMKQGNNYAFVLRYFGDEQLKSAAQRFNSPKEYNEFMNDATEVFAQLDILYRQDANPAGKEGQELAARWWNMVSKFIENDPNLLKPLISAGKDINNWPEEAQGFQEAIEHFLAKALNIYLNNNGIQLSEMGENE